MRRPLPKEWILRTPDEDHVRTIREATGLSDTPARILVNRGIAGTADAERFLSGTLRDLSSPFRMRDLEKAAARVVLAGRRNEPVLVYADYDVDGATGSAILGLFLAEAFPGLPVRIHQNHRVRDGYGMRTEPLDAAAGEGCRLVITVDCGISDGDAIRHAARRGMDVVVTDHHSPGDDLPPAYAVLNPKRRDCDFPEKEIAGVGVVFMLVCGIRRMLREEGAWREENGEPNLRRYLDLVALGTVADMVPLRGDNRIFVRAGLEEIRSRPRTGIRALLSVSGTDPEGVTEADLGFRVGPRLNAAGRVGDSLRSSRLLMTGDPGEAGRIARELNEDNGRRQREEERMLREAERALRADFPSGPPGAIVLADPGWHMGVLGIVASKIAERHFRPAALLTVEGNEARGSLRSADGFPLLDALSEMSGLLTRYGGHSQAAGVSLPVGNLPAFREGMDRIASRYAEGRDRVPRVRVDAEVDLGGISPRLMGELDRLRPFGIGNEEPVLAARGLRVERRNLFGGNEQHLRLELSEGGRRVEAVAFHGASIEAAPGRPIDLLFTPQWSAYRGTRSIRLLVRGSAPAAGAPA